VRVARWRDARACLAITWEAMHERPRTLSVTEGEFWDRREWRRNRLGWGDRGTTLAAEIDGKVIGTLSCARGSRAANRHAAEFGIIVGRAARGLGAGRALITAAEVWGVEHGVLRMTLGVFPYNERALRLYESLGYVREGVERDGVMFPEGGIDVIRMFKRIGPPRVRARGYDEVPATGATEGEGDG